MQPQPTCSRVSPTRQVDGLSLTASSGCSGRQVARTSAGTPEGCNAKRKFTVSCSDAAIHPLSGLSHLGTPAGRRVGSAPRSGDCVAAMARRGPPAGAEYPDSVGLSHHLQLLAGVVSLGFSVSLGLSARVLSLCFGIALAGLVRRCLVFFSAPRAENALRLELEPGSRGRRAWALCVRVFFVY